MATVISYEGYCFLGGAENPKLFSKALYDNRGDFLQMRYYFIEN